MMRCNDCRALALDHLYDLLDEAEAVAVRTHLAECADCSKVFDDAARAQGLIAQAAKQKFSQVIFAPPGGEAVYAPRQEPPPKKSRRFPWVQWAVAASVLALIPGTLYPLNALSERYRSAKASAEESSHKLADAKRSYEAGRGDRTADKKLEDAKKAHQAVVGDWLAAARAEADRKVAVSISKPVSAQPGAPNEFVVAVADDDSLRGNRLEAQFRDQGGAVLFSQAVQPKTPTNVRLPADVWSKLTPQSEVYLSVAAVNEVTGIRAELQEPVRLFGPIYATMLVTDKNTYRPGERLFFRSLTLDRITFRPPARDQNLRFTLRKDGETKAIAGLSGSTRLVKVADGSVDHVTDHEGKPIHGVGCGEFILPADLADGDYILTLTELTGPGGIAPAMQYPVTKTIKVRAGKPERFTKLITLAAPSFAPGQEVVATAELKLADKPVAGAKGTVVLASDDFKGPRIIKVLPRAMKPDGNPVEGVVGLTDDAGRFRISFALPDQLPTGDVKLMVTFSHEGVEEAVAKRVPIAGKEQTIEFFPEGGKLVAGVPNRVYVRGSTPEGKGVDIRGTIAAGTEIVAKVESATGDEAQPGVNRGLGSFTFTPKADVAYEFRMLQGNRTATFPLPKAETDGVVMTALDTVIAPGQPLRVRLASTKDRKLVVGAYTRGRLADTKTIDVKADTPVVVPLLAQADSRGGVTRVTVFKVPEKGDLIPVAERLVFRKPGEVLNLKATPGSPAVAPGGPIDLTINATDEKGNPVPAILWAAAVNSADAAAPRDRSLPTHFLLAGEVQTPDELEYADFLLTDHPKAADSLDHVLATQGWRRFVEQNAKAQPDSPAAELFKLQGKQTHKADNSGSLYEKFWPRLEESAKSLDAAQGQRVDRDAVMQKLYADYEVSRRTAADLAATVEHAAKPFDSLRDQLAITVGCVALLTGMLGLLALVRGLGIGTAAPYFVGTLAAIGLAAYLSLDASANPATVPTMTEDRLPPPEPYLEAIPPKVKLPPLPKDVEEGVTPDEFKVFGIGSSRLKPPGLVKAADNAKASVPSGLLQPAIAKIIARPVDPALLSTLITANQAAGTKAGKFGEDRAVAILQKMEAALIGLDASGNKLADGLRTATPVTKPLFVREYAASRANAADVPDSDTILWQPVIVVPRDGRTVIHFRAGSAPGYQVIVAGHTADGRIGSIRTMIPVK
jgi:hypothetical protein